MMNFTGRKGGGSRYEPMRAIDSAGTSKADKLGRPELAWGRKNERKKKRRKRKKTFLFYYYLSC